jgi:site-specific DNA-methyltransferase (adenine-specific)
MAQAEWALRHYGSDPQVWGNTSGCPHDFGDSLADTKIPFAGRFCSLCGAWKGELGNEPTLRLYLEHLCEIFDQVKRVLKKAGTCWVVMGDTFFGDSPVRRRSAEQFDPACQTVPKRSAGGLRRSAASEGGLAAKSLCQIPARFAIEMANRGWLLRNELIWWKPNCMPSSARDRFTIDFEKVLFFVKNKRYHFATQYEPAVSKHPSGNTARRIHGDGENDRINTHMGESIPWAQSAKRIKRSVWQVNTRPFPGAHFAVYPPELIETPIRAGCPRRGIVLDPFLGSGTTAGVALQLGRRFVGIEINPRYIALARRRIAEVGQQRGIA